MRCLTLVLVACLLAVPAWSAETPKKAPAKATAPASAEALPDMKELFQSVQPLFGVIVQAMLDGQLDALAKPEAADKLASFTRNYYLALVKKGFTPEEALRLTMAIGVPTLPMLQR